MTTDALITQLISQEGYRQKPYKDSRGFWTGGVGHLLSKNAIYPTIYDTYTHADWMHCLGLDIASAESKLDQSLPWWRQQTDVRQDVMVCLAFNIPAFVTWHHTVGDMKAGNFKAVAVDLENDQPWASQVKGRAKLLAETYETGEWPK